MAKYSYEFKKRAVLTVGTVLAGENRPPVGMGESPCL